MTLHRVTTFGRWIRSCKESAVRGHRTFVTAASVSPNPDPGHGQNPTGDNEEVQKFEKLAATWWDPTGPFKPLHSMNLLRVQFIRNGFVNSRRIDTVDTPLPLQGLSILDIGCGGGILSQPLARLGATVTGIDAGSQNIQMAKVNLPDKISGNVQFVHSSLAEFVAASPDYQFDGVVASEIIEHVDDPKVFLQLASQLVKPSGSIFLTTINRTDISWLAAIVGAEYLLRIVPTGTHDWKKFISPDEIQRELKKCNCRTRLVHGMTYNPLVNSWSWSRSTAVNYALHAVKD